MTGSNLPSDLIAVFRKHFLKYEASGVVLQAPAVRSLSKMLITIEEIARDFEDDYRLLEKLAATKFAKLSQRAVSDPSNSNVVPLKPRPRILPPTGDGGDAA